MNELLIQNTIIHKEMNLPPGKYINNLNISILHKDIQQLIRNQNSDISEVYGIESADNGPYYIFIYIGKPFKYPYTRITLEFDK